MYQQLSLTGFMPIVVNNFRPGRHYFRNTKLLLTLFPASLISFFPGNIFVTFVVH